MRKHFPLALIAVLATTLTSCEAIEGIFKAGMWAGVIMVVVVLAIIIWVIRKLFGGRG